MTILVQHSLLRGAPEHGQLRADSGHSQDLDKPRGRTVTGHSRSPLRAIAAARTAGLGGFPRLTKLEATNVRRLILELDRRYPSLGRQIDEGMAVAIDGEIYQDAYLASLKPESELYLIPKIGGG